LAEMTFGKMKDQHFKSMKNKRNDLYH